MEGSKEHLLELKHQIDDYLTNELGLTLHPHKVVLQPADWPISFLGQHIHPHYSLPSKRVIYHFKQAMGKIDVMVPKVLNSLPMKGEMDSLTYRHLDELGLHPGWQLAVNKKRYELQYIQSSINSYLGILRHTKSFHLAQQTIEMNASIYCINYRYDMTKGNLYYWYRYKNVI